MGNASLSATARLTAAGRALEHQRPDRLFADPLAEPLAGAEGFALMDRWRLPGEPRENPTIGPRTRFHDDLVISAVGEGIRQVVLIAAGMDTRAFRLSLPSDAIVFELDLPALLAEKQSILEQKHAEPCCRRIVVGADLAEDAWSAMLIADGFDPAARTVFIVEGLSWYLTEEDNARLLEDLRSLAAPGSRLGIDIISADQLESPAAAAFFAFTATLGIVWQFGTNDPAGFLNAHGWPAEVTDLEAFARRVGRRPPADTQENIPADGEPADRTDIDQRHLRSASILFH